MNTLPTELLNAITEADEAKLDSAFAVLKYREIGILRKARCWALIFGVDENDLLDSLPKASDSRILDKISRTMVHEELIKRANQLLKEKE
jgi:hypothetical protein